MSHVVLTLFRDHQPCGPCNGTGCGKCGGTGEEGFDAFTWACDECGAMDFGGGEPGLEACPHCGCQVVVVEDERPGEPDPEDE